MQSFTGSLSSHNRHYRHNYDFTQTETTVVIVIPKKKVETVDLKFAKEGVGSRAISSRAGLELINALHVVLDSNLP